MTGGPARPGLGLLVSLFAAARVGRPGPARAQAVAAARTDRMNAHVHLLDAAYAALVAGEPRAADRLIAECEAVAPRDETWQRRIAATKVWSWTVDRGLYPGDVAAELMRYDIPQFPEARPGDPETRLVEAIANDAYRLRVARTRTELTLRGAPGADVPAILGDAAQTVERLESAIEAFAGKSASRSAALAFADLLQRSGSPDDADRALATVRREHEVLAAEGVPNPVGQACTFLVEGDWYATPGSSPESLGFDLPELSVASPFLARRDLVRAAAAYDRAGEWLAGVDEPRAHGALALRRAALAWASGDHLAQQAFLGEAADAFRDAGDVAAQRLTEAHGLVAEIAIGHVAGTRSAAGARFDLEPRGRIAEAIRWGERDGSVGWTTALGRLFQRAAEEWQAAGDYERAAVAYELAAPLVPVSGAESPATVALRLATLDRENGFGVRALTRCRAAIAALPPVADAVAEMRDWQRNVSAVLEVVWAHLDATATAAGMSVPALEWACERIRELLALPGVPAAGRTAEELAAEGGTGLPAPLLAQLAAMAEVARQTLALGESYVSSQRAEQAAAIGAIATADRWCDDALRKLAALPSWSWPRGVGMLAARDRFDEARARLAELVDAPDQRADFLAVAAVRAREYECALRFFEADDNTDPLRSDLIDHAEAALGAGRVERALALTDAAVRDFEAGFARLRRDVDRLSVSDDVTVARLYLVAARAQLARAEQLEPESASGARARAFELSDRARALALEALLADVSDDTDDARLILAWRATTAEHQAAYERLYRAYAGAAADGEVAARVAELVAAEGALVEVEAELESASPAAPRRAARREPPSLGDVQAALPPDTALVEYQLVGHDLLVWMITRTTADTATSRHPNGEIARLAKAVQRGCANGRPGQEADELAAALLAPAASVIAGCRRLILVPYGPLNGLPFQVLSLDGRALGETHVLSYLPAAALLGGAGVDEPLAGRRALIVGDPAFDARLHPGLPRLPGAAVEAAAIAGTYGAAALIGPDAAEPAVRRQLARCDLVHLAAHGRLDPVAPSDSSIVLAGRDELTVADLVGLRIDAELAVLSACDSGRGAASLGNDVVGLARGLIAAGARRSVVTLWPVDDAPACVTMSLFHERLAEGLPVATALHAAQNAIRAMSGTAIAARYAELGGTAGATASTRRRGGPSAPRTAELPLDPEFVDDLADADAVDGLDGELARIWAPFVVIGA